MHWRELGGLEQGFLVEVEGGHDPIQSYEFVGPKTATELESS